MNEWTPAVITETLSIERLNEMALQRIRQGEFSLLQLVNGGEILRDIRFLGSVSGKVQRLRISACVDGVAGLDTLTDLAYLDLGDITPDPVRDFSPLSKLRSCRMGWSSKIKAESFFSLPNLETISLLRYNSSDCEMLGKAKSIRFVELRRGQLASLTGIGGCPGLKTLRLNQVRGLRSLAGLEECKLLQELDIVGGKLVDEDVAKMLGSFSSLTDVSLDGTFELTDLNWVLRNPGLRRFRSDAVVKSVNWDALFASRYLSNLSFKHTVGDLPSDEFIKGIAAEHGRRLSWVERNGTRKSPWVEIHFKDDKPHLV